MKRTVFQIILSVLCLTSQAQKVSNIRAEQRGQNILVLYSLETTSPCEVSLLLSQDNGATWSGSLKNVSGDAGITYSGGEKQIIWNVLDEREQLVGAKIKFKVIAKQFKSKIENRDVKVEEEAPLLFVQEMPYYPGGERALYEFLYNHITYPPDELSRGVEGVVMVNFVVEKDGRLNEFVVTRGVEGGVGLNFAALEACRVLGNFIPGKQNGTPQRVYMTIPIKFTLSDK
jgi:TonB family protein